MMKSRLWGSSHKNEGKGKSPQHHGLVDSTPGSPPQNDVETTPQHKGPPSPRRRGNHSGISEAASPSTMNHSNLRRRRHLISTKHNGGSHKKVKITTLLLSSILLASGIYLYAVSSLLIQFPNNDPSSFLEEAWPGHRQTRNSQSSNRNRRPRSLAPRVIDVSFSFPEITVFNSKFPRSLKETKWNLKLPMTALSLESSEDGNSLGEMEAAINLQTQHHPDNTTIQNSTNSEEDDEDSGVPEDKGGFHVDDAKVENTSQETCRNIEEWQSASRPNCNTLHELDLDPTDSHSSSLQFLGQGWFRSTWRMDRKIPVSADMFDEDETIRDKYWQEQFVFKMLRLEREYLDEYYELHRRDAVAMEHLTFSPFVMDVYGYCGQSAINELAEFRDGINSLEQLDRRMRGKEGPHVLLLKLRLAMTVTVGLYHVQYGRSGLPWEEGEVSEEVDSAEAQEGSPARTPFLPTMAHYDINPRNIAITKGGRPKLNDFNIAEFLQYPSKGPGQPPSSTETCGFPSRLHEPWWRAPEEMNMTASPPIIVNEKVDVYALGSVLFHILTTHSPRGKMKKERMVEVRDLVTNGIPPTLMEPWASSKSAVVKAFQKAMDRCFEPDPGHRGTTGEVAIILHDALEEAKSDAEGYMVPPIDEPDQPKKRKPHDKHHKVKKRKKKKAKATHK